MAILSILDPKTFVSDKPFDFTAMASHIEKEKRFFFISRKSKNKFMSMKYQQFFIQGWCFETNVFSGAV